MMMITVYNFTFNEININFAHIMKQYKTIHENKVMINPPEEVKRFKQSPLQRILRVMKWNYNKGINKESVNSVYRNIIKQKLSSV